MRAKQLSSLLVIMGTMSAAFIKCDQLDSPTEPRVNLNERGQGPSSQISDPGQFMIDGDRQPKSWRSGPRRKSGIHDETAKREWYWETARRIDNRVGGKVHVPRVFSLEIQPHSMNTDVAFITAKVTLDGDRAIKFEFQPSGLQFNPPAMLELRWANLPLDWSDAVNLMWWNPSAEDWVKISDLDDSFDCYHWDGKHKRVTFKIHHFSMYSFSKD